MTSATIQKTSLKAEGIRKAEKLAQLLPNCEVKISSTPLEWGVWAGGIYCGGFCWDDAWFRMEVPAEGKGEFPYIPCPIVLRQEVRQVINQVLEAA
jgi:hypothetical protein